MQLWTIDPFLNHRRDLVQVDLHTHPCSIASEAITLATNPQALLTNLNPAAIHLDHQGRPSFVDATLASGPSHFLHLLGHLPLGDLIAMSTVTTKLTTYSIGSNHTALN